MYIEIFPDIFILVQVYRKFLFFSFSRIVGPLGIQSEVVLSKVTLFFCIKFYVKLTVV